MKNPFKSLLDSLTGKSATKAYERAMQQQQAAINAQQQWEREQAERLNRMQDVLWKYGTENLLGGPQGGFSADLLARDWQKRYLDYLQKAPETEYAASKGAIERQMADLQNRAAENILSRGISGTGLAAIPFTGIELERARMLGDLEREREKTRGESIAKGTQFAQDLAQKFLNIALSSAQLPQLTQTRVPEMMQNMARSMLAYQPPSSPLMEIGQSIAPYLLSRTMGKGGMPAAPALTAPTSNPMVSMLTNLLPIFLGKIF